MRKRIAALLTAALLALGPTPLLAQAISPPYAPGQLPATATNDNAAAGALGEFVYSVSNGQTATVTISIASPAVITWTGHGLQAGTAVCFTTTGALPTGLAACSTTQNAYYVIPAGLTANSFEVSTSPFGTAVNTSGTQSGAQTATAQSNAAASGSAWNLGAIQLTAGDWDVCAAGNIKPASTSNSAWIVGIDQTSATDPTQSPIIGAGTGPRGAINAAATANAQVINAGCGRASLSGTTVIYAIGSTTYTGTAAASNLGWISGRRTR